MAKSLIIVESPAKARTINRYLGDEFVVKASVGHIKDLPEKRMGVDIENSFTPEYVVIKGKRKVINELKKAACKSKTIYLAPDPDREGEIICWHLANELNGGNIPIYRVIFNEITKEGIAAGMANPGQIDLNKVNAQQARRILDRLVGYNLSPLLGKKVRKGLSAGRVQSVALRLICEREREIEAFIPQEYWSIQAELEKEGYPSFKAKLEKVNGKKPELKSKEDVESILKDLKDAEFKISKVMITQKKKLPLPPFITSTLQQEAVRRLKFGVKKTMLVAQQLYEGINLGDEGPTGLITYMRTDSLRIAFEAQQIAAQYIKAMWGVDYLPSTPPVYKSREGAQEAHEAIRPTSCKRSPDEIKQYLSEDQYLLYRLIWLRFLASQMSAALIETTRVDIEAKGYLFRAHSSRILFPGFMILYDYEDKEEDESTTLPPLAEGDILSPLKFIPDQHFTQPPPRYNEATLVKTLEERGIGRPSTYATILDIITTRDYVRRLQGRFYPTELGILVNDLLVKSFPKVLDPGFTAQMEENLDEIESGKRSWIGVLDEFWSDFEEDLKRAQLEMRNIKKEQEIITDEICKLCGGRMILRINRYGDRFLGCANFPKCRSSKPLEEIEETNHVCSLCGARMVARSGRYGRFLSCSRYPECRFTKPITLEIVCPMKGCQGELVVKRSKKGRIFYGCNRYPECSFTTWYEPIGKCPECGHLLVKGKEEMVSCLNPDCKSISN